MENRNVIRTMGKRLPPTHLARSPECLLMQLVDRKRGSSFGPSHSRPSDVHRFRSAAGEAEKHAFLGASCDPV